MKTGKRLYIVEGEIEELFLRKLKENNFIPPGKTKVFNLIQKELSDQSDILSRKYDSICCILDTDRCEKKNLQRLKENVDKLNQVGKVCFCIQNKNFEDEMIYIFQCNNIPSLCQMFHLKYDTTNDLKRLLAQKNFYVKHLDKTKLKRYCCRQNEFINCLQQNGIEVKAKYLRGKDILN